MGIDPYQLRIVVIRPTLTALGLWSKEAEEMVLGTSIQESGLRFLRQMNGGPGMGLWQMEPATHNDIWVRRESVKIECWVRRNGFQPGVSPPVA